jgi:hypothetical protein
MKVLRDAERAKHGLKLLGKINNSKDKRWLFFGYSTVLLNFMVELNDDYILWHGKCCVHSITNRGSSLTHAHIHKHASNPCFYCTCQVPLKWKWSVVTLACYLSQGRLLNFASTVSFVTTIVRSLNLKVRDHLTWFKCYWFLQIETPYILIWFRKLNRIFV